MTNVTSRSHISEIWIFEVIFVDFRLMKNVIFNKTESFIGRNTSDHTCQIVCSKSNCETMYHWFFLLEITVVKIMNNLNVCSAHSYLYPQSRFNPVTFYWSACTKPGKWVIIYLCVNGVDFVSFYFLLLFFYWMLELCGILCSLLHTYNKEFKTQSDFFYFISTQSFCYKNIIII